MTNEEIRIKVAEAMGARLWNNPTQSGPSQLWGFQAPSPSEVFARMWFCGEADCLLPDYPFDLNACAEFEYELKKLGVFSAYLSNLALTCGFNAQGDEAWFKLNAGLEAVCSATARQRCIAYLRTKGIIP